MADQETTTHANTGIEINFSNEVVTALEQIAQAKGITVDQAIAEAVAQFMERRKENKS